MAVVLSERTAQRLIAAAESIERQVQGVVETPDVQPDRSPDIYWAKVPAGGIPARVGMRLGHAECELFKSPLASGSTTERDLVALQDGANPLKRQVYNSSGSVLFGDALGGDGETATYVPTWRNKSGAWITFGTAAPGSSTSSSSSPVSSSSSPDSSSPDSSSSPNSSSPDSSSPADSSTSPNPCPAVAITETDPRCENGILNVYNRTVSLNISGGCLTKSEGAWTLSHTAGCCDCPSSSSPVSSSPAPSSSISPQSSSPQSSSSAGACSGTCRWVAVPGYTGVLIWQKQGDGSHETCTTGGTCTCRYPSVSPAYQYQTIDTTCADECGGALVQWVAATARWNYVTGAASSQNCGTRTGCCALPTDANTTQPGAGSYDGETRWVSCQCPSSSSSPDSSSSSINCETAVCIEYSGCVYECTWADDTGSLWRPISETCPCTCHCVYGPGAPYEDGSYEWWRIHCYGQPGSTPPASTVQGAYVGLTWACPCEANV